MNINIDDLKIKPMALKESLAASLLSLKYVKTDKEWKLPGVLGFPSAILLFCFIDSVGSLLLNNSNPSIGDNFEILRDKDYFNIPLSQTEKRKFYESFRYHILHLSELPADSALIFNPDEERIIYKDIDWNNRWCLNLAALHEACDNLFNTHEQEIRNKSH